MKSTILTVGTEILFGEIVNTNTVFLSQQLNLIGIDVMYHHTVGDNDSRLKDLIDLCFRDCDLIITTGGLGPTEDDLTKETVAAALGDALVMHQPSFDAMKARMEKFGRKMTPNNIKQAYLPRTCTPFPNACGTAPGFALEKNGKIIICLPGPPHEMKDMWEKQAKPYLAKFQEYVIYSQMIKTVGIGESALETRLLPLIDGQTDPTLATYAKPALCDLRIASKRKTEEEAKKAVADMLVKVKELIGESIYSETGESIYEALGKACIRSNITISVCESATGGLFAGHLTDIPGISAVFDSCLVTYSNESKIRELNVSAETLERFGAVSAETAKEMAEGLARKTGSDLCISITGIAGPDGGTPDKPAGIGYVGCCYKGNTTVTEIQPLHNDSRALNRDKFCVRMATVGLQAIGLLK